MSTTFPRKITMLRKERGLSQKQAATELGISQALLSHYEKGIRECKLEFVVRVADYYNVSCDFLLGRTADISGTTLSLADAPTTADGTVNATAGVDALPVLSKKLIINSLNIVFDLLQKCDNRAVSTEASAMLMLSVYSVFRHLHAANPKNQKTLFALNEDLFRPAVIAQFVKNSARMTSLCAGRSIGGQEPLSTEKAPLILTDNLNREYPLFAGSLFHLLQNAEELLDDI